MRGLIALCVGLVMVLGASAAWAQSEADCCQCECPDENNVAFCAQGSVVGEKCEAACAPREASQKCFSQTQCSTLPQCQERAPAPAAGPFGIITLLIALGGFGAWRLRKRAA